MNSSDENLRLIMGLKIKHYRSLAALSLRELAEKSGLSISYINEIEKGKKYPKADKVLALANALSIPYDELVSIKLTEELSPLASLLSTSILRELPFDLFGIDASYLMTLMADAPDKFSALGGTLVEIARNYDVSVQHFFFAALRSYQEIHHNYFEELEVEAIKFRKELPSLSPEVLIPFLKNYLREQGIKTDDTLFSKGDVLQSLKTIFSAQRSPATLYLNPRLQGEQQQFHLIKEAGFKRLNLSERPETTPFIDVSTFDQVLNNFKASYFAGATVLPQYEIVQALKDFFLQSTWSPERIHDLLNTYHVTPEVLFYRFTQLIPHFCGLPQVYFLRFNSRPFKKEYVLTKELHFSNLHSPHGIELHEHYCRRWITISILEELREQLNRNSYQSPLIRAQISRFWGTNNEYLNITIARPLTLQPGVLTCMTIGFLLDESARKTISFSSDPSIPFREVNETCERCGIMDCAERTAPPRHFEQEAQKQAVTKALRKILKS